MKRTIKTILWSCALMAGRAFGQSRELGVIGGFGFSPKLTLSSAAGSAQAGFQNGAVVGVYVGENAFKYIGGEIRYLYRFSNMKVSAGGTDAQFDAHTQIAHMDMLVHFQPKDASVRAFVAFGGGVRVIQGTGMESSFQPLHEFAALTKTLQVQPVGDAGAGVKINLQRHVRIRLELRDYISAQPSKVIAAAPGVKMAGMLHDMMGLAALSYTW